MNAQNQTIQELSEILFAASPLKGGSLYLTIDRYNQDSEPRLKSIHLAFGGTASFCGGTVESVLSQIEDYKRNAAGL